MRAMVVARSVAVVSLWLLPALAHAQGAITGIVKDSSGGVLPGGRQD